MTKKMGTNNNNGSFMPVIIYDNADIDKLQILSSNKGKTGIYQWKHKGSGKIYIGSAFDLFKRLRSYFFKSYLTKNKSMYINRSLLLHGHLAFSLSILEYIDISNLSKEQAKELILSREQFYIDTLSLDNPMYNILPIAGSRLGSQHTEKTKSLISLALSGENHYNSGKSLSAETKFLISEALSKDNNPMFGQSHSEESKALISQAHLGKIVSTETKIKISKALSGNGNPMFENYHSAETKALMREASLAGNNPMFGKEHSAETKDKMSAAQGTTIYVYSSDKSTLLYTFTSANKAAKVLKGHYQTILKYAKNGSVYKEQWFLSCEIISKE